MSKQDRHKTSSSYNFTILNSKIGLVTVLVSLILGWTPSYAANATLKSISEIQVLKDSGFGMDGLAGARVAELTPDGSQILVSSADDNSLAIFDVGQDFHLTFNHVFKNDAIIDGLNGAASLVVAPDGKRVYVVSYYDSALTVFEKNKQGDFEFIKAIRDGLPYEDVFSEEEAVKIKDKLALLGAYDIAITADNSQLFVASVASNAVAIFTINKNGEIIFERAIRDGDNNDYGLRGAVNVVISPDNSQVLIAGYNEDAITIFNRNTKGILNYSQTLLNEKDSIENMLGPQGLAISPDGKYLYVACGKGNALIVFAKNGQGKYSYIQSIGNSDDVIDSLGGAGHVTTSPDGMQIYIAAESSNAVVTFIKLSDGKLKIHSIVKSEGTKQTDELNGPASVYVTPNGEHLVVTTGKGDSLIVYSLK
ncbi:MAG: beta-propeller fold lactonase family protein [Colwellia sp.]|nr:beta-propeller fold lactonase family protein [Colwellia sp.]